MDSAAPVLVVGQGLAGTLLAWELERADRDFVIVDAGHKAAASRVGAGLVNPVTGERWVVAPGWAERSAAARETYQAIETAWGARLVTSLRIHRVWRSAAEAALVRSKAARGDLAPWVSLSDEEGGAQIEGAWRVDLPALIAAGRSRWAAQGRLRTGRVTQQEAGSWKGPVVWCRGAAETELPELRPVGGETLDLEVGPGPGWRPELVRHDGFWILPVGPGRAWAGATFLREESARDAKREELRRSAARQLADMTWRECAVLSGWRMCSPDRAPRSGWLPRMEGKQGVFNGLGSKGGLLAPGLAKAWAQRLGA